MNALTMKTPIIAVDTSTIPADVCGAVTFWRLQGACDFEKLKAALDGSGITPPSLPSATEALKRACTEQAEKHLLVRPLPNRGGFALVRETPNPETGTHSYTDELVVKLKVEKNPDGTTLTSLSRPGGEKDSERAALLASKVRASYDAALMRLDSADVGSWLVTLAKKLQAVSLRESGGVYFVPRPSMTTWRNVTRALAGNSAHVVAEIPSLRADEAVAAVLDALTREAEAAMKAVREALAVPEDDAAALGSRALQTKQREAEELQSKLASYEQLLDVKLDAVREALAGTQGSLSRAYLAAIAED